MKSYMQQNPVPSEDQTLKDIREAIKANGGTEEEAAEFFSLAIRWGATRSIARVVSDMLWRSYSARSRALNATVRDARKILELVAAPRPKTD